MILVDFLQNCMVDFTESLANITRQHCVAKQHQDYEFSPFPELLIEGFDRDQIWEEIAAQNEPFLDYAKSTINSFSRKRKRSEMVRDDDDEENEEQNSVTSAQSLESDVDEDEMNDEELDHTAESADEGEEDQNIDDEDNEELEEYDEENEKDEDDEEEDEDNVERYEYGYIDCEAMMHMYLMHELSSAPRSEVDDDFFNLEEFNKWTEKQEELDMMSDREDEDDDEVDYDMDLMEVEDEDEDGDLQDAAG